MKKTYRWKKRISLMLCLLLLMTPCLAMADATDATGKEASATPEAGATESDDKKEDDSTVGKDDNKKDDDSTAGKDDNKKDDDKKDDGLSGEELQGKRKTKTVIKFKSNSTYSGDKVDPEEIASVTVKEIDSGKEVKNPDIRYYFYKKTSGSSEPSESDYLKTAPTDSGNYWVRAHYRGDAGHSASFSLYMEFSIDKATPKILFSTNMTEDSYIGDTIRITAQLQIPGRSDTIADPNGEVIFWLGKEVIETVNFVDGKAAIDYILPAQKVNISAEFVPSQRKGEISNLRRCSGALKDIQGKKKDQDSLGVTTTHKTYGSSPFKLELSGGNGTGGYTYTSSDETVATVAADGTITLLHPGTTKITVIKAADDTYNETSQVYELIVDKGENPDKPKKIVEKEVTNNKVAVNVVEGQEYSIDGGVTWNTTGVFKKLKANKDYTVITRICETEYYAASSKTTYLKVKTAKQKLDKVDQEKEDGDKNTHSGSQNFGLGTNNKVQSLSKGDKQTVTTAKRVNGTASTGKEGTRGVNTLGKEEGQTTEEEATEESTATEEATTVAVEATTEAKEDEETEKKQKRSSTATVKAGMSVLILALAALTFIYFNKRETNL